LRKLAAWLKENHCSDVCMESTGKYWFPVHNILEKDFHVVVSHPKFVKAIKGKKTDMSFCHVLVSNFINLQ